MIVERTLQVIRGAASGAARLVGLAVVAMAVLISLDVVSRKLLSVTLLSGGVGELSGYLLALLGTWGASLTLLRRAHVRIDTLLGVLPPGVRIALDLLAAAAFLAASLVLTWMAWMTFSRSFELDSHSMTPLAVPLALPQGLWLAGLGFLSLTSLALLCCACLLLARGDRAGAARLIGPRSVQEELKEQTDGQLADEDQGTRRHA